MRVDQLMPASTLLGNLTEAFASCTDEQEKCALIAVRLTMANLHVTEVAKHLIEGMEPYDAIVATANGEMQLPVEAERLQTLLDALVANMGKK